jgi:hypothetical protein
MRSVCCLLVVLLALTAVGCAAEAGSARVAQDSKGRLPPVDAAAAQTVGLNLEQVDEASKLYNAKCLRCHKSYDPRTYTDKQWQIWMSKMNRKAHLDSAQQELLGRYLKAVRDTPAPPKEGTAYNRR